MTFDKFFNTQKKQIAYDNIYIDKLIKIHII